jgi:peptide/nickel transport system substrate-binding protein
VAAALILGGCTSKADTSTPTAAPTAGTDAQIDRVVWGVQSPPASMDGAKGYDLPTRRVSGAAFDRVLRIDNEGKLQPWIAESWTNPDPLTYIYKIRSGVKFWDGSPLTAEDVAFSLSRHLDPKLASGQASNLQSVKSASATDASTVTVKLTQPAASFAYFAALGWDVIEKKYSLEAGADLGTPSKPGMGTGPYTITSFSTSEGATLERFEGYWGEKPKVKTLVFKAIQDPDTARLAMLSGDIQGFFDVPLLATRQFDTTKNVVMTYVNGAYNDMLTMNVTKAPFDDPNVRKAVAQLVDRAGLLQPLFNGKATLASTIVPNTQLVSVLGEDGAKAFYAGLPPVPAFDVEAAKASLAASKSPNGFEVTLPVDTTQPWMSPLAQNLAENAKKIGITINVKSVSSADWVKELTDPKGSPLQLLALGANTPSPGEIPPIILAGGGFNVAGYTNPKLVTDLAALGAAPDAAATTPLLVPILTPVGNDLPYLPLYDEQTAVAMNPALVWKGGYSYWAVGQMWPLSLRSAS